MATGYADTLADGRSRGRTRRSGWRARRWIEVESHALTSSDPTQVMTDVPSRSGRTVPPCHSQAFERQDPRDVQDPFPRKAAGRRRRLHAPEGHRLVLVPRRRRASSERPGGDRAPRLRAALGRASHREPAAGGDAGRPIRVEAVGCEPGGHRHVQGRPADLSAERDLDT